MKKVYGISLSFSSFERGLWFDSDQREYQPEGWGIRLNILFGKMIRPVPKFWKLDFWRGKAQYNPWKGGEYWGILRIPFIVGPFIAVALGKFGFYIGFKTFLVKTEHQSPDRYGKWLRPDEFGTDDKPGEFLQLSITFRRSRWR